MSYSTEDLYDLLPAVYRSRDAEHGNPLRGLLGVLAEQAEVVDRDIAGLYDNWFVETCDEWVLPYIGDLLAVRALGSGDPPRPSPITPPPPGRFSRRAYVANTLAYRRRKGTVAVLEQLAFDLTGWPARAVEFFALLATTQHLAHLRPDNHATPDLRDTDRLELLDGPFDRIAHTAEARSLDPSNPEGRTDRGRFHITGIGVFLWRLPAYPVTGATARLVDPGSDGFSFDPFGLDAPLFNRPRAEAAINRLAGEPDLPGVVRRRALYDELEARRQALVDRTAHRPTYFTEERPVLRVAVSAAGDPETPSPIPAEELLVCDLSDWRRPPANLTYAAPDGSTQPLPISAAIDPELGRLTFPDGSSPDRVRVDFAYGFSGDIGGGPYDRRDGLVTWLDESREVSWQVGVTQDAAELSAAAPGELVGSLTEAVLAWNALVAEQPASFGVIAVTDSSSYAENLIGTAAVDLPAGARLAIVAAGWPAEPGPAGPRRQRGRVAADAPLRPHLRGRLSARGGAGANPGELIIQGLAIEGPVTVLGGNLGGLRLLDCTLAPFGSGVIVNAAVTTGLQNRRLRVSVDRCLCGSIALPGPVPALHLGDSVVQPADAAAPAIDAPGADADVHRCTVLGGTAVRSLNAGNTIFTAPVAVTRRQQGCVRYCHVPDEDSVTPRRFRCQPDLALRDIAGAADRARRRAELAPAFTSTRFGDPGFAQLADVCAREIREGAEDGSEMGAFSFLRQPHRHRRLRAGIDEYLRFGLEAGFFFVT